MVLDELQYMIWQERLCQVRGVRYFKHIRDVLPSHLQSVRKLEARKKLQVVDLPVLISQDIKFTHFMQHNGKFPAKIQIFFPLSLSLPSLTSRGGNILKDTITLNQTWAGFKVILPSCGINKYFPQFTGNKSLFYRKWNPFTFLLRCSDGSGHLLPRILWAIFQHVHCDKANISCLRL